MADEGVFCRRNGACEVQCALCAEEQRQMTAHSNVPPPGPLPAAPAGPVGTFQGAIRPDIPKFRWPKRFR